MSFRSYNWLKDGLLPFSVAIMITCWLSSWMLWARTWSIFSDRGPVLSPASLAAVLVVSTFLTKALLKRDWALRTSQTVVGAAGFAAIFLFIKEEYYGEYPFLDPAWLSDLFWSLSNIFAGVPPQLAGLLLGAYLWWRGITLGRESVGFGDVLGAFQVGIVMLVGLLVLSIPSLKSEDFRAIQEGAVPAALAFFFFSLLALSLSRIEAARDEARRREGKALGFSRDWLLATLSSIVVIVLLGFIVTSIFSFDLASRLLGLLLRGADLLLIPVYLAILAIGFFVQYIIYLIQFLLWLFKIIPEPMAPASPEASADEEELRKTAEAQIPPEILQAIEWAIVAAIIALVLYLFVLAFIRLRRREAKDDVEEVRESLWSWQAFLDDVMALLSSLWLWLFGRRQASAPRPGPDPYRADPQYQVSLSIRHIYRSLLSHTARLGFPRGLHQTPYEYLPILATALPPGEADLLVITEAYVKARYSGQPALAGEFQVVDQAWLRVRTVLRGIQEGRKQNETP